MAELAMLYDETARAVAACVQDAWEHIIVNYEMRHRSRVLEEDCVSLYVRKNAQARYQLESFSLSEVAEKGFYQLSDALYAQRGSRWGAATLTIEKNGTHNFAFSYELPKRLNGVYDKHSFDFYNNYLDHYLNESAA